MVTGIDSNLQNEATAESRMCGEGQAIILKSFGPGNAKEIRVRSKE